MPNFYLVQYSTKWYENYVNWIRTPSKYCADDQMFFRWEDTDALSHLPEEHGCLKCSDILYGVDGTILYDGIKV